jgi:hypothetical protein
MNLSAEPFSPKGVPMQIPTGSNSWWLLAGGAVARLLLYLGGQVLDAATGAAVKAAGERLKLACERLLRRWTGRN